ncbi:MAG: ring,2-phenylacetyl-CoA epoxidase subunit PaaD [Candidatus Binatota bacterium]|jgi:ring-1,2-phenylacetyl-CoA epoxidase subunit PaaD|nr:ring,2-phenylacetyl-CoA epoxidase subunit PaaD [Candidatus Binatota bacterium]
MVTTAASVLQELREVRDPEIPALDVVEMGIVRAVEIDDRGGVEVVVTPTYSGCPAMRMIEEDVVACLQRNGHANVSVRAVLSPPWTTDALDENARGKLRDFGIDPPPRRCAAAVRSAQCPRCGAESDDRVSEFGSTPCKSLWRCRECGEPFELFKPL